MFVIPKLLNRYRRRSAIINISSNKHLRPDVNLPVFCAAKSFSHTLSQAMIGAYDRDKLDVMTVTPGMIMMTKGTARVKWSTSIEAHGKAVID